MTEEEKALSSEWFVSTVEELSEKKRRAHRLSHEFNNTFEEDKEKRDEILKQLLKHIGKDYSVIGPIYFHYGCHTSIGDNVFMNMNFLIQDDASVTIGDDCRFGPNFTAVTPLHPLDADQRRTKTDKNGKKYFYCQAKPIVIGHDCWFGASVTVCPGVTIGDNCVIGAGSVVTKDIPDNSLAYGVPCRAIRTITEKDKVNLPE